MIYLVLEAYGWSDAIVKAAFSTRQKAAAYAEQEAMKRGYVWTGEYWRHDGDSIEVQPMELDVEE